jgi:hypothetical protein
VPVGPSGKPEINVGTVPVGGSLPVSFPIYTKDADVGKYTLRGHFGQLERGHQPGPKHGAAVRHVDIPHTFTVVQD